MLAVSSALLLWRQLRGDRRARARSRRAHRAARARTRSSRRCRRRQSSTSPRSSFRVSVAAGDDRLPPGRPRRPLLHRRGRALRDLDRRREGRDAWPGEAFGEIALLRDIPRTATVTAVEDTKLLALERDEFIAAVTGHAPSREAADAVIGARLAAPMGIGSGVTVPAHRRRARRALPRRRRGGVGGARRALLALRLRDRRAGLPPVRAGRRGRLPGGLRADVRAARPAARRRAPCKPWLAQLTRNLCVDRLRDTRAGRADRGRRIGGADETLAELDLALTVREALRGARRPLLRPPRPLLLPRRELQDDRRAARAARPGRSPAVSRAAS